VKSVFFYLGLALLFTHELDSMPNHEWRVLPVLRSLSDSAGESAFIVAHIPIFALTIAYVASLNIRTRKLARNAVGGFFIAHAILHMLFSGHPNYEFSSLLSGSLIYGAALCGIAFLLLPADQPEGGRA
jgi:inner membrane protein involved in colicin E2 resistance